VGVAVDGGIVTLTGTVNTWAKKCAAQQAAHRVLGVLDVANDLEVKVLGSGQRNDTDIARAVRHTLEWNVFVPDERIRSTVTNGFVTLEGDVNYGQEREDAEKAVRDLAGVRGIVNKIVVKAVGLAAVDVRKSIEEALERQAERDARHIQLEVRDGKVILTGVVHSWKEREAVLGAARGTHGVQSVESRLSLQPYAA
jgi:osmotically-inducible protein OsmY